MRDHRGGRPATIQLTEGDYAMSSSPQHFYGGHFQGCSFGERNSLTNYFGVVDKLDAVEGDIKQKLKEAREAIENAKDLSGTDKKDAIDQLNNLTAELEKPEKDESRVQRYKISLCLTYRTVIDSLFEKTHRNRYFQQKQAKKIGYFHSQKTIRGKGHLI